VNSNDPAQSFLNHTPIPGVLFEHNDFVNILSGPNAGMSGSLVTVLSLLPEPEFLIELESGYDVTVLQSQVAYAKP
jgi:hypothetical protein